MLRLVPHTEKGDGHLTSSAFAHCKIRYHPGSVFGQQVISLLPIGCVAESIFAHQEQAVQGIIVVELSIELFFVFLALPL